VTIGAVSSDLEGTGTTVKLEIVHFQAFSYVAEPLGVYFDDNNVVRDIASRIPNAIGGGDALIAEGISRLCGGKASTEEIRQRKIDWYQRLVKEIKIEPREGYLEVLRQILERKPPIPMAIASLTERKQAEVLLEQSGIGLFFQPDFILLRDSVKNPKPAPDVYLEAARRMDVDPRHMLVFEDSVSGITAARRAGCPVVAMPAFDFTEHIQHIKDAGPVEIFMSWTEIDEATLMALLNI